jgi:hypothetical protein
MQESEIYLEYFDFPELAPPAEPRTHGVNDYWPIFVNSNRAA